MNLEIEKIESIPESEKLEAEISSQEPQLPINDRLLAMGQMAACLAHELRNPLGSIELYCSLLKRELGENARCQEILGSLTTGVRTMGNIISNCLQFTKEIRPNKKQFTSASLFLEQTCEFAKPKGSESGVVIEWVEEGVEPFSMDPYLIGQVAINLILNAVDASIGSSEPKVKILLSHTDKNYWTFEVIDTGPGLTTEVRRRMFDPFFTTKEKGTGLGLPIVYAILTGHDGEIEYYNLETRGTKVVVKFENKGI